MKKQFKYLIIILLVAFCSCKPKHAIGVLFGEPQPSEIANLTKFPKWIIGNYQSIRDNDRLIISENRIVRVSEYKYDSKIHPNELDSSSLIIGDSVLVNHRKYHFKRDRDSLIINIDNIIFDTLFDSNSTNLLRASKGNLFINRQMNEDEWEVQRIKLQRKLLTIGYIPLEKIDELEKITGVYRDTTASYKIKPTRKQFESIVKNGGFCSVDSFIKKSK